MNEQLGETTTRTIENCQPGDVFELADSSKLAGFEDEVAKRFIHDRESADIHQATWEYRQKLIDSIRPEKDISSIKHIIISVMPDAYDRVFDLNERGKKYKGNKHPQVRTVFADKAIEMTVGFEMTFETKKGIYSTEVYYVPIAENSTTGQRATANTGGVINRYLAVPEIIPPVESETVESTAKTIGAEAVQRCVPSKSNVHPFKL